MTTRQALDLPLPHLAAGDEVVADDRDGDLVAARRARQPGTPSNTSAVPSCSSGYSGAGLDEHARIGDPHRDGPGRPGPGLLGVGRPHLDLGPVDVPGQHRPLVGDHLGCDAQRQAEHCRVAPAVPHRQRVERRPPAVLERPACSAGIWQVLQAPGRSCRPSPRGRVSSSFLGGDSQPVRLALACARPAHHSAPMADPRQRPAAPGPTTTDTAMTVHFTMSATTMNGVATALMCFSPTARKTPSTAMTTNSPSSDLR